MAQVVHQTSLTSLPLLHRGKVRDIYEIDADHMLVVVTDRVSAFDVIMPNPIPFKGVLLTRVSNFWFERFTEIIPNQVSEKTLSDLNLCGEEYRQVEERSVIVKRLHALPVEAIVRGYLIGSGWKEYQSNNSVCGIPLPSDIPLAGKLPASLFTPSTKAAAGEHDENISYPQTIELIGEDIGRSKPAVPPKPTYNRQALAEERQATEERGDQSYLSHSSAPNMPQQAVVLNLHRAPRKKKTWRFPTSPLEGLITFPGFEF
ncbi:MAG: phosphoribosylaminoimidazolesuccinocarboxamide synthase [Pseudomonadota bacterium]